MVAKVATRPKRRRAALAAGGAIAALAAGVWLARETIAQGVIDRQLGQLGLPAHYGIESIGTGSEVLKDIVIGDPAHPDLTIARAEVELVYGLTGPRIGRITLDQPRLYGTFRGGKLSFGALDPLLFPKEQSKEPFSPARSRSEADRWPGAGGKRLWAAGGQGGGRGQPFRRLCRDAGCACG